MERLIRWMGGVPLSSYRKIEAERDFWRRAYNSQNNELWGHIRACEKTISEQGRDLKKLRQSFDPYKGCIDHNARHAAQTRIRALENQLRRNGIEPA